MGLRKAFGKLIKLMNENADVSAASGKYFGERQSEGKSTQSLVMLVAALPLTRTRLAQLTHCV